MIAPGKRWFLYRSVSAGGGMHACLSWEAIGYGEGITRASWHGAGSRVNKLTKPLDILLVGTLLDGYKAHGRPRSRLSDSLGIAHIVLVRLHKGLDEL